MPITEYVKQCDSGIDLPEDIKAKIRNEVSRVLQIKHPETKLKRKKDIKRKYLQKKAKTAVTENKSCSTEELEGLAPELAFADVNDIRVGQILEIKHEIPSSNLTPTLEGLCIILKNFIAFLVGPINLNHFRIYLNPEKREDLWSETTACIDNFSKL